MVEEQHRRQLQLARQMVDDPQRRLPIIVEKPAVGPQHAKLQRIRAPMIVAAKAADLGEIRRR